MNIEITVQLFIRMGYLHIRTWYGIVENLAVDILLRTLFINRCIRRIFPTERQIVPCHSKPVVIISTNTVINSINDDNTELTMNTHSQDDA